jgi:hypothetical protein
MLVDNSSTRQWETALVSEKRWATFIAHLHSDDLHRSAGRGAGLLGEALGLGLTITPDSVGCSVTEQTGSGFVTPAASNELALQLDHAQYAAADGPCVAACRDGLTHGITIMSDEDLYSSFTAAALGLGVRSSLSLPLVGVHRPAALNLYAQSPSAFESAHSRGVAALLARCVAALLPDSDAVLEPTRQVGAEVERKHALMHRAQRVLTGRYDMDEEQAFTELVRRSRAEQCSVFAVAQEVMAATDDGGEQP